MASIPRTILGIVVAAVALILVPNCSAPMVTNMAQKPVPNPSPAHIQYILAADPFHFVVKNKIMNKAELIAKLADDAEITKTQANAALDSFIEAVTKTLKGGGKVTLVGFGTFSVSKRAARNGRNPQTGAVIKIKARKVAKFKAGKELSAKM